jgi:hypothetical protein
MRETYIPFGVTAGVKLKMSSVGNLTMHFTHVSIIPSAFVPQVAAAMKELWSQWHANQKKCLTKEVA